MAELSLRKKFPKRNLNTEKNTFQSTLIFRGILGFSGSKTFPIRQAKVQQMLFATKHFS
jgi:hypothetical protein